MKWREDLRSRMRQSSHRPVSPEARDLHRAAIDEAVRHPQSQQVPALARRRLVAIGLVATLGLLPAGIAVAAESSLPGDLLYPIKRATEAVRSLVDSDIAAEHRVEELEQLVSGDASESVVADQLDRVAVELDRLPDDHDLRPRMAAAIGTADKRVAEAPVTDDEVVAGDPLVDRTTTTVSTAASVPPGTIASDRPADSSDDLPTDTPPTTTRPPETTPPTTSPTLLTVPKDEVFPVRGRVLAGPTCPVQKDPPDRDCDDVAVAGAVLVFKLANGEEVVRIPSGPEGEIRLRLPAGVYLVEPQPVDGLLGTAPPQEFELGANGAELVIAYDTGIR